MQPRTGVLGNPNIPVECDFLADRRYSRQTELVGNVPFIDRPRLRQCRRVTMRRDQQVKILGILHAPA